MDFRVLGPLEVIDGGRALALGGVKQRSLLAILLQHPNAIVSTDHLLAELWGDTPPASADNSIHVYVSRLRKVLGPDRLITRPPGYALRVDASELDLAKGLHLPAARGYGDTPYTTRVGTPIGTSLQTNVGTGTGDNR
jgi:DNA-binding SARP family transcriptional activator